MNIEEKQYKKRLSLGQSGNALVILVAINLLLFVSFEFLKLISYFNHGETQGIVNYNANVLPWFSLSSNFHTIISRPWTILTYMFIHDNVWYVFTNMIWLWAFGFIMQDLTGNRKIVPIFIYGGLAGGIAFVLSYNLIPSLSHEAAVASTVGSSAAVMSLAIATTLVAPGYKIFPMLNGGFPLWILTALYVAIDLLTTSLGNPAILIVHVAGALMGFLFIFFLRRGYDWSDWMNNFFDWVGNLFNPDKLPRGKRMKDELFYKSGNKPFEKTPNITQQRIDEILDKINQKGYSFLTEEEKEFLRRASKEDN